LERSNIPGITTQTARLRYFSLFTWVWKVISELKLSSRKALDIEKVVTLVAASHHIDTPNYPLGIRNKGPATTYLQSHNLLDLDGFTDFGRKNIIGYGNLYYSGPLATMYICSNDSGNYVFSNTGKQVADITENALKNIKEILLTTVIPREKLNELVCSCFCANQISNEEKEIWRLIFFGFTKPSIGFGLDLDLDEFNRFNDGKMVIQKIEPEAPPDLETYLKFIGRSETALSNRIGSNRKFAEKSLQRRYVLFLIMKIIGDSKPKVSESAINQAIRDCIYFNQYDEDGSIQSIDFGKLEQVRETWEVYVHNLYYINFLEYMFNLLLDSLKAFPNGTTIEEITTLFDFEEVERYVSDNLVRNLDQGFTIQEIDSKLATEFSNRKTSLKDLPNEKLVAFKVRSADSKEEKLANLLILFILVKHRFNLFTEKQKSICYFQEKWWNSILPHITYKELLKVTLRDFLESTFELIKNRHKFISAKKFEANGTKSWLLTEEDGQLYFYGRDYRRKFYRESKWTNIVQLLADMDLIEIQDRYRLTTMGEQWLAKIS